MTFDLLAILVFGLFAVFYAWLLPPKWRAWALLVASIVAIFWLQPPLPIRFSDFILPTLTILLTVVTWYFTRLPDDNNQTASWSEDRKTIIVIATLVVGLAFMRYVDQDFRITASRPPPPLLILLALALIGGLFAITGRLLGRRRAKHPQPGNRVLTVIILLIVVLFAVVKTEFLATVVSGWWRGLTGQDQTLASMVDLRWVGFSFVAFRLIHTLRDRRQGILPVMSLREFVSYVIFFPSYTAGPIDRAERFVPEFRALPNLVRFRLIALGSRT